MAEMHPNLDIPTCDLLKLKISNDSILILSICRRKFIGKNWIKKSMMNFNLHANISDPDQTSRVASCSILF